jgi:hypothetical protein
LIADDGNVVEGKSMAETLDPLDKVAERLTRLEVTVAQGFHDAEERDLALARKVDIQTEAIRADLRAAIDAMNGFAEESRRTADSLRKEHAADRAVLTVTLQQHARRLHDLETTQDSWRTQNK